MPMDGASGVSSWWWKAKQQLFKSELTPFFREPAKTG